MYFSGFCSFHEKIAVLASFEGRVSSDYVVNTRFSATRFSATRFNVEADFKKIILYDKLIISSNIDSINAIQLYIKVI